MTLADLTEPKLLVPRLLSQQPAGAIQELTRRLESTGRIGNASGFAEAVLNRESQWPTLLEQGIALPHARGSAVQTLSLAVGHSPAGLPWGPERRPVSLLFLFAVPVAETQGYLAALSALAHLLNDPAALEEFTTARQPEAMRAVLERASLPDLAQALQAQ
jgi:mannitol/fructose-specific phosphotransferase system IIA component (Ntr-type)